MAFFTVDGEKPITIKLYKPTHAKLKIYATLHDKSLDDAITEILEEVNNIDMAKFVEEGLNQLEEDSKDEFVDEMEEEYKEAMGLDFAGVKLVHPKKKVNLHIPIETHKKLKIIASLYDESLEGIASNLVENRVNDLDIVNMVSEEFAEDDAEVNDDENNEE